MITRLRYLKKTFKARNTISPVSTVRAEVIETPQIQEEVQKPKKNNRKKEDSEMLTKEQIEQIEAQANAMQQEVKVVKKDKGLIERTESSKIVLTEDNRQVLND